MRRFLAALIGAAVVLVQSATLSLLVAQADLGERAERQQPALIGMTQIELPAHEALPGPDAAVDLLASSAEATGTNILRTVTGFGADDRSSTGLYAYQAAESTSFTDGLRLTSGRWPTADELASTGAAAASVAAGRDDAVGVIADVLDNDEVVFTGLRAAFDAVPVAGTYTLECQPDVCMQFIELVAAGIDDDAITAESLLGGSSNTLASSSTGLEAVSALIFATIVFTLLLLTYYQVARAKRIGVMRLLGVGQAARWWLSVGRWLLIVAGTGIIASATVAALVPGLPSETTGSVVVTLVVVTAGPLIMSLVATVLSGRIRLADALKDKRPIKTLFALGSLLKVVAAAMFIVTVAGLVQNLGVLDTERARLAAWADVADYGVLFPKSVGNDLASIQSGGAGTTPDEVYELYPVVNDGGGVFTDVSQLASSAEHQLPPGTYPAMRVNPNYLDAREVLDAAGQRVAVEESEQRWVVLVPESLRAEEQAITEYFQSTRGGAGGVMAAEEQILGRPAPATLADQQVEIRWIRDGIADTFSTEYPVGGTGAIDTPIIEVMTSANSVGLDRANAFSGAEDSAMKVYVGDGTTADAYAALLPDLERLFLADNFTVLVSLSEVIESQLALLEEGIRITILSAVIAFLVMLLLGTQNVSLAFDRFGRAAIVRKSLGYPFGARHRPTLTTFAITWVMQVLLAAVLLGTGAAPYGNAPLISMPTLVGIASMLAVEIAIALVALTLLERRRTAAVLKGNE